MCAVDSIKGAVDTVIATIQLGVPVRTHRILDDVQMDAVTVLEDELRLAPPCSSSFTRRSDRMCRSRHRPWRRWPLSAEAAASRGDASRDRERLWHARTTCTRGAGPAARCPFLGPRCLLTDLHALDCVLETKADHASLPSCCLVGHAGDGNFHVSTCSIRRAHRREMARRAASTIGWSARALGMGNLTGEHGVGYVKMKFLEANSEASRSGARSNARSIPETG